MKNNDLDIENWKELDINVDSLWLINERDKSGKHSNVYHGNFIPQIPNQLIRRFTKKNDVVLDMFLGSGTTLYECEKLNRRFIGYDINNEIIDFVNRQMKDSDIDMYDIQECDVTDIQEFGERINTSLSKFSCNKVQFAILHPPYMDIIKFTDKMNDLSQFSDLSSYLKIFNKAVFNAISVLEHYRYFAIVIGDVYKNSEVIPLAFYVIDNIKRSFKVKLKGIIIKNIEGNRGKIGKNGIWRYRALMSDYYIFKHEYIIVFKKDF